MLIRRRSNFSFSSGQVVEYIQRTLANASDTAFAYYYFTSVFKESLSVTTFLRSVIFQIIRAETLIFGLQSRVERIFTSHTGHRDPEIEELETLLIDVCAEVSGVVLLIDGVNEADQLDQKAVLDVLKKVIKLTMPLKIFITSQPEVNFRGVFNETEILQINLKPQDTQRELEIYINLRVDYEKPNQLALCSMRVIDDIKAVLKTKAEGM